MAGYDLFLGEPEVEVTADEDGTWTVRIVNASSVYQPEHDAWLRWLEKNELKLRYPAPHPDLHYAVYNLYSDRKPGVSRAAIAGIIQKETQRILTALSQPGGWFGGGDLPQVRIVADMGAEGARIRRLFGQEITWLSYANTEVELDLKEPIPGTFYVYLKKAQAAPVTDDRWQFDHLLPIAEAIYRAFAKIHRYHYLP